MHHSGKFGRDCKTGFNRVCETLKSGKKCCGCVPDKNAKPENKEGADEAQALMFACTSNVEIPDGSIIANRKAGIRAASEAEARIIYMTLSSTRRGPKGPRDLYARLDLNCPPRACLTLAAWRPSLRPKPNAGMVGAAWIEPEPLALHGVLARPMFLISQPPFAGTFRQDNALSRGRT